jgi:hypothetical protein
MFYEFDWAHHTVEGVHSQRLRKNLSVVEMYILDSRAGLLAIKGVPSAAGRNPPSRRKLFWVGDSQPLWGLGFF